jgi:hypothetical protein
METISGHKTKVRAIWVVKVLLALITYHLSLITSEAQTFTDRLQTTVNGQGRVVLHQDPVIDALVNGPAQPLRNANGQQQNQRTARDNQANSQRQQTQNNSHQTDTDSVSRNGSGRTRQVVGYRIQAFAGGNTGADRQRAERIGNALRSLFPGQRVYVHFYSPRWICRMGNYRTYEEAREMCEQVVRAGYESATIVRGRITVSE